MGLKIRFEQCIIKQLVDERGRARSVIGRHMLEEEEHYQEEL